MLCSCRCPAFPGIDLALSVHGHRQLFVLYQCCLVQVARPAAARRASRGQLSAVALWAAALTPSPAPLAAGGGDEVDLGRHCHEMRHVPGKILFFC